MSGGSYTQGQSPSRSQLRQLLRQLAVQLREDPDDLLIRLKLAEVLRLLGKTKEAIELFASVAWAYALDGNLVQAIMLCKVILELAPGHQETQEMLAKLYVSKEVRERKQSIPVVQQDGRWVVEPSKAPVAGLQAPPRQKPPVTGPVEEPTRDQGRADGPIAITPTEPPLPRSPGGSWESGRVLVPDKASSSAIEVSSAIEAPTDDDPPAPVAASSQRQPTMRGLRPKPSSPPVVDDHHHPRDDDEPLDQQAEPAPSIADAVAAALPPLPPNHEEPAEVTIVGDEALDHAAAPDVDDGNEVDQQEDVEEHTDVGLGELGPATNPDSAEPDSAEPDSAEPDSAEPDSAEPDSAEPDSAEPDSAEPDSAEPDSAEPALKPRQTWPGYPTREELVDPDAGSRPPEDTWMLTPAVPADRPPRVTKPMPHGALNTMLRLDAEAAFQDMQRDSTETHEAVKREVAAASRALDGGGQQPETTQSQIDRELRDTLREIGRQVGEVGGAQPPVWPLFSALDVGAFIGLVNRLERRVFAPGTMVLHEGDSGDSLMLVGSGHLQVLKQSDEGASPVELARLGPGSFFGEFALLADQRRHASVRCLDECELLELRREVLAELCREHPSVGTTLQLFYEQRVIEMVLATSPLFLAVSPAERMVVAERFTRRRFAAGEVIVEQGGESSFNVILLGQVCVSCVTEEGREVEVGQLSEGDYFGELSLLSGEPAEATVRATRATDALALGAQDFYDLASLHPEIWAEVQREGQARQLLNRQLLDSTKAGALLL